MILIDTVKNRTIGRLTDKALVCLDLVDGVDLVDCVDLVDSGIADGEPAGNSLAMTKNEKEFSFFIYHSSTFQITYLVIKLDV